jgi:hypothetical protein
MPVRNGAKFLGHALNSTLAAMGSRDELLVFDDGSTDNTPDVLASFSDNRLRVVRVSKGVGIGEALNNLIDVANGDFIARMDADDICLPWRFDVQLAQLSRSQSDAIFGGAVYFGARTPPFPVHWTNLSPESFRFALLSKCPGIHPTLFAQRSVFEGGVRYKPYPQEDLELWLQLSIAGKTLRRYWTPVIAYRRHPLQISRTKQHLEWEMKDARLTLLRSQLETLIQK